MKRISAAILITYFFSLYIGVSYSQEFEMPGYINDISSCDMDADSFVDIIVSCPYTDTIVILYNDGIGNFTINYYNRLCGSFIPCGLIDSDPFFDIITGTSEGISFIKNLGQRNLSDNQTIIETIGNLEVRAISDLNLDSLNDLLYTYTPGEYWGIFKNNGNLNFTNEIIQSGSSTTNPAVGLFTDDSLLDIVLTYSAFDRSSVYVNNGNLNFSEVVLAESFIGEAFVMNIDNQGPDDFLFVNYYTNTLPLYKFIGNEQFELQSYYYATGIYTIASFLADDFNQDGYDDFIISRCNWYDCTDSIYVYFNDLNWSFHESQKYYVGYLGFFNLKSADLNDDSFPDLYMSGAGTNGNKTLKILWNDGSGSFSNENPVLNNDIDSFNYQLNIFPNPFHDYINIEIPRTNNARLSISIFDMYGRLVRNCIDVETYDSLHVSIRWDGTDEQMEVCSEGIYILVIRSNSNHVSKKIIKY